MSYEIKVGDRLKTEKGYHVRIICTDFIHPLCPIIGIITGAEGFESIGRYTKEGKSSGPETHLALPKTKLIAPVLVRLAGGNYTFESYTDCDLIQLVTKEESKEGHHNGVWIEQLAVEVPDEN